MAEKPWQKGARQRFKERTASKRFKLSVGETTFRVLPNMNDANRFPAYFEYRMHSNVGPNKRYMRCGKKFDGKDGSCFLCDVVVPKLEQSAKASSQQAAINLAAVEKFAVQIIYKDNESGRWLGPTLWEAPSRTANSLLGMFGNPARDYTDPKTGRNLTIIRTGTGFKDTKYEPPVPEDERSAVPADLLAKGKKFADLIPKYDVEKMKAAYYGHEQEEEVVEETAVATPEDEITEESVEEAPKPTAKKPVAKKKSAPPPVEEEEETTEEAVLEEEAVVEEGTEEVVEEELTEEVGDEPAMEEFEELEPEPEPVKPSKKPVAKSATATAKKKSAPPPVEEEEVVEEEMEEQPTEEEFEELVEEEPAPPPKKTVTKKPAPVSVKKPVRR